MNTAGGNDEQLDSFVPAVPPDPSVRDVLAQLDRIETKLDELTLKVKRVTS